MSRTTRTHRIVFEMINAGEFTPEEALAEARHLSMFDVFQDTVDMLVGWAWAKQDELKYQWVRMASTVMAAEIATARNMHLDTWERNYDARIDATYAGTSVSSEPF